MSIARECDVCGDFYRPYNADHTKPNAIEFISMDYHNKYIHGSKDCCPDCMKAIKDLVEHRKKEKKECPSNVES